MVECKQLGHFQELGNHREPLIHALEVNSP